MSTPLHLEPIPFITLPNWVKAAAQCGFNIEPVFREVGIETDLIHLESATVSAPLLQKVMEACVERTRGSAQHFPFVLGETFAFDYLPDIDTFLATSPTLRDGLQVFDWVRELINPLIQVRLAEAGDEAHLVLALAPSGEAPPYPYFSETTFASIVKFGRRLLGSDVPFQRLCFCHPQPPHAAAYEAYFRVPVLFDQPQQLLAFDRALLDQPLEGAFPALHRQARYRVEQRLAQQPAKAGPDATPAAALVAAIEQAFAEQPALLGQGIERMAAVLKLHPRTVQRRLQDADQRYAELQDRARFRLAVRWLEDGRQDIETISERLGFSDRRSFTRAFTRWSGTSPSAFRGRERSDG
ncbi:MAG: AraC family transcriptional regulator ligand-binding domain-containing protein [Nevskia sp.]|uniref:AraC family transcriptional regulator ligand-binding domain-containing protein n=1 Tax=Nevskia sp. TaxID=1929292 RepID=UPI004035F8E7